MTLPRIHQSAALSLFTSVYSEVASLEARTPAPSLVSNDDCSGPTTLLEFVLLDYKQFKAARTIQRHVRGWLTRNHLRSKDEAATVIAKSWRGYWVRRRKFDLIESMLQSRIAKYYNDSATKIQCCFRGWQTRKNYHDFQGMHSLRTQYAEDMLSSLAINLYKMRKRHALPGIYALRQSDLLTKIEDLATSFGYRFHNGRVRAAIAMKRAMIRTRRKEFMDACRYTPGPYPGPNSDLHHYSDFKLPKTIETRHQRTVLMYDKSMRDRHVMKVYNALSTRRRNSMAIKRESVRDRFCKDFVKRIMRENGKVKMTESRPGSILQFMEDLVQAVEEYNCYCKPKLTEDDLCF